MSPQRRAGREHISPCVAHVGQRDQARIALAQGAELGDKGKDLWRYLVYRSERVPQRPKQVEDF